MNEEITPEQQGTSLSLSRRAFLHTSILGVSGFALASCTRGIMDRLNRTFVTPLDREDIHALAGSLDDVMDAIDAAAAVVRLVHGPFHGAHPTPRPGLKRPM